MTTELELCHHLNYVRQNYTKGKVRRVPDVGYNTYKSQYEEPTVSEGFSEILKIDFVPIFDDSEHEATFKQWTT
jgi:bifunctional polynucleotide phosphatase/kinase